MKRILTILALALLGGSGIILANAESVSGSLNSNYQNQSGSQTSANSSGANSQTWNNNSNGNGWGNHNNNGGWGGYGYGNGNNNGWNNWWNNNYGNYNNQTAPTSCKVWNDGCNTCTRQYPGGPLTCTNRQCFVRNQPSCNDYFNASGYGNGYNGYNSYSYPWKNWNWNSWNHH